MNSASRRPSADSVGLRRPGGCLLRRRRPTLGVERLERPISIGGRAFGRRSACADRGGVFCVGGGRRLARSARRGRFQSAGKPSADGRPAPTGRVSSASAEADAWRGAPGEADFNRRESLRPTVGLRRPGRCLVSAEADARRGAPGEADFNRRESLRPTVGLERRMNSTWRGLRPTVGLRRPGKCSLRRRRPTPGAQRLGRPISIGVRAFGRRSACADRGGVFCVGGGRRPARSA
jgi:hypothetical protein